MKIDCKSSINPYNSSQIVKDVAGFVYTKVEAANYKWFNCNKITEIETYIF